MIIATCLLHQKSQPSLCEYLRSPIYTQPTSDPLTVPTTSHYLTRDSPTKKTEPLGPSACPPYLPAKSTFGRGPISATWLTWIYPRVSNCVSILVPHVQPLRHLGRLLWLRSFRFIQMNMSFLLMLLKDRTARSSSLESTTSGRAGRTRHDRPGRSANDHQMRSPTPRPCQ